MKFNFTYSVIGFFIVAIAAGLIVKTVQKSGPGEYDDFAACLTDNGAVMYGADWCSNCQAQKKMFGKSFEYIDYVQCDIEPEKCEAEGIEGYPTWKNNSGMEGTLVGRGVQPLQDLANAFACELPVF
ncbi:MAG: thioredoxin family protein [Candidatus Peregrinibacteria bacterium]|nr:thioredoxin family protein [Candidatus Peregrinibacteria bacterium]MDZ4244581.1 thioredoxin family protein [Candidatus Gracilibacteria bacterium]